MKKIRHFLRNHISIKTQSSRSAFTMLEIVFVILITGLVSVAGGKAIVQILQNYTLQKDFARLEMESTSAIRQISRFLQNSVWDSIATKAPGNNNACNNGDANSMVAISNISSAQQGTISKANDRILCFIEKNMDAINGRFVSSYNSNIPYFSGFIDLDLSGLDSKNKTLIATQFDSDAIRDLESLVGKTNLAIYFPFVNVGTSVLAYDKYYANQAKAIFKLDYTSKGFQVSDASSNTHSIDKEYLALASSPIQISDVAVMVNPIASYLTVEDGSDTTYQKGDLVISRNTNGNYTKSIIARNLSNLHLWTENSSSLIRIRVCFEPSVAKSIMDEFCKEGIIMQ